MALARRTKQHAVGNAPSWLSLMSWQRDLGNKDGLKSVSVLVHHFMVVEPES